MEEKKETSSASKFSVLGLSLHIGFYVSASALIFILGGLWLDKKFNTLPLFVILGVFASLGASTYEVYRIIRSLSKSR